MKRSMLRFEDSITEYPNKKPGVFTRLATPAQRRAFWAKVSSGEARVGANGYVRTNRTKSGWTVTAGSNKAVLTNRLLHSRFVHGDRSQATFNRFTGFQTASRWERDNARFITRVIEEEVAKELPK